MRRILILVLVSVSISIAVSLLVAFGGPARERLVERFGTEPHGRDGEAGELPASERGA
jgi:hypothetical protein